MTYRPLDIATKSPADIDYSDIHQIIDCQQHLCHSYENEGGFKLNPVLTPQLHAIRQQGEKWMLNVEPLLLKSDCDTLLTLIPAYDFMHRICRQRPCFDLLRKARLGAIERAFSGLLSSSQDALSLIIAQQMDDDPTLLTPKRISWHYRRKQRWIEELKRTRTLLSPYAPQIIERLKSEDLFAYFGDHEQEHAAKSTWTIPLK